MTHGMQLAGDGLEEPQTSDERREPNFVAILQRLCEWCECGRAWTDVIAADIVLCVCGQRTILRVTLSDEMDVDADWAAVGAWGGDICTGAGSGVHAGVGAEECDQRGAAVEGVEDSCWSGSGGAGGRAGDA